MKASLFVAAAGLLGSALANGQHAHAHGKFHRRGTAPAPQETCGCTTRVVTYYAEPTLVSEPEKHSTTTVKSTSYTTLTVDVTASPSEAPLPTNIVTVYPTPGTYTIPATTIIVSKTTTVCDATSTPVAPGTHTFGGVTTSVTTATTITCPYATVEPTGSTFTSIIKMTTFTCPSAGTYTIAPSTTAVESSTVIVYPTPATFTPGTYTQPGKTLTVTKTNEVVFCPKPTNAIPAPPVKLPVSVPAVPSVSVPVPAVPTKIPTPKVPTPKVPEAPTKPSGGGLGGGEKWGMTYSPYTNDGQCKDAAAVLVDIGVIKGSGFNTVRIYSSDCDGLKHVGDACKSHGLKMILGVFISETGIEGAKKQVTDITSWGSWELVELIVVGNEAIHSGHADAGSLAGFISSAKGSFKGAGYNGPVTTTEPTNVWQANGPALCGAIDVLGANIHCFFNPDVTAPDCGKFVAGQIELLGKICPGKEVVNLETGWPNKGSPNSLAIPGLSQQKQAIDSLITSVGSKSVFFSFGDDAWKAPGPFGIEQHWGCINLFQ
ncbi:uncharacterized protein GIQ15_06188 [Arthroderma uncinatum]|uniref:uncharacterized protein n=1 Tax=Arthroderma uncinatum TaxID=74035 RepID=UPI00144A936E|nr:uncharacterized protein GIQ15_06188 [Arthroderma uncinatum]KAF3480841.1 hypothetical protein GIQ15_06188 [Arthroderma uncinatum]